MAAAAPHRVILELRESDQSWKWWPHRFHAKLDVQLFDDRLSTSLTITNCDQTDFDFTAALHTYLRVSSIEQAEVLGLQGQQYIDAGKGNRLEFQRESILRFVGEVDRVYMDSGSRALSLRDASNSVHILPEGFTDTVVWNPGAELAAGMGDLGPGNHVHFVCVEAAQVKTPIEVAPGMTWRGVQTLVCTD